MVNTIVKKCPENFQDDLARESEDYREYNDQNIPSKRYEIRINFLITNTGNIFFKYFLEPSYGYTRE